MMVLNVITAELLTELLSNISSTPEEIKLNEEQFLIISGGIIEIVWTLRVLVVVSLFAFIWGLVRR